MIMVKVACPMIITHLMAKRFLLNPIQTGGGDFLNPPSGKVVITPTPKEL